MKTKFSILIISLLFWQISAQKPVVADSISRKQLSALKRDQPVKIDGILDDEIWKNVPAATNFVERQPNNGKPQPDSLKTEVRFLYDDTGLYIAAQMYDPDPSKILKELTERDNIANDDFFGIIINGYNDHQQSLEFIVTAAGVQIDGKLTTENEDMSWNAVWYSAVKINEKGWAVEMKIPFFELRFPKKDKQKFGLNMIRKVKRTNTMYDWNHVDNEKGNYTLYDGVLNGVTDVKTPTRLSFTPYFSTYVNTFEGKTETNVNGGMDLKYGINDAFTFDMTLIPDFGQANFDNSILNLTPFEQQFAEQRSFFMEGTELFSKGDMFYSRRVGGSPSRYPNINEEKETVTEYPSKVKLFNAFKISGRTKKGLGIGIFNGVTEKMEATIQNNETGTIRKEVVEPWTNYNVLVLDQRFGGNSSVTLVNTSTTRNGDFRDANATGLLWSISNKANTYTYYGNLKGSWIMNDDTKFGNRGTVGIGKFSGKHRFEVNANYVSKDWDINDLGFSTKTNYGNHNVWYGYRILQPTKHLNNMYLNFNLNYYHRLKAFLNQKLIFNHNNSFTNKKFQSFGGGVEFTPYGEKDIYEPRSFGRYLKVPGYFDSWLWFESDSRKKVQYNINIDYYAYDEKGRNYLVPSLYLRYRASDKLNLIWQFNPVFSNNEVGYSGKDTDNIYMGRRQRNTYENAITGQYTFDEKMSLALAFRHYFSDVTYKQFYILNNDGSLDSNTSYHSNLNGTYNSWNVDLRYSWWFAPGSQLTLLYRNATTNYLDISRMKFKNNFDELFNSPMINNFSLRISYFLDYNRMKKWF